MTRKAVQTVHAHPPMSARERSWLSQASSCELPYDHGRLEYGPSLHSAVCITQSTVSAREHAVATAPQLTEALPRELERVRQQYGRPSLQPPTIAPWSKPAPISNRR